MFFISTCSLSVTYADFFKDQKLSVDLRNFYIEREFKDVETENIGSWSQAFMGRYESGYTNTPIQLGVDASAQYALRLNNHNVSRADTIILYDLDTGRQDRDYAKFGATLKLKYNKTELKIGELLPKNPIVYIDDSRQLLTTYQAMYLSHIYTHGQI